MTLDDLSEGHKFTVDAMQDSLEVVSFARVFRVKQLQEAVDEVV